MRQLTALVYAYGRLPDSARYDYSLAKLWSDGSLEPVTGDVDQAIAWMRNRRYRDFGFWINDHPAIAWTITPDDFVNAWVAGGRDAPVRCPCRYADRARHESRRRSLAQSIVHIGQRGLIVPTRSTHEIVELRRRFPYADVDMAFVPRCVLHREFARYEAPTRLAPALPL